MPYELPVLPPPYDSHFCNVVIFGETGAGKSSVVNLIAGRDIAKTSPDAGSCTFTSNPYHVVLENRPFCVWDTVGLNEPEISQEEYLRAIKQAYRLIKGLEDSGGVHLLLLCTRGRVTKSVQQNYKLFANVLCEKKVPLGVVVTNLENEPCMEQWWTDNENVFDNYGIFARGHACVTATPGIQNLFLERYKKSGETMRKLLLELTSLSNNGWRKEERTWLTGLLGKLARILPQTRRLPARPTNKELAEKLTKECGFTSREAAAIATSITDIRDQRPPDSSL